MLALVLVVPVVGITTVQRARSKRNKPPAIQSFQGAATVIELCPFVPLGATSPYGQTIPLVVGASDPDNDNLTYKYSASAGSIVGNGAVVNWNLTRSPLGVHTAKVEVIDGRGGKTSAATTVKIVVSGTCDPPCPTITVSCPSQINEGEVANFVASVSGDQNLTYLWRHSNGKRLPGQTGSELKIVGQGLPGDIIKATVVVLGVDPACTRETSCESRIVKRGTRASE